jgi:hypothetical protein
VSLLSDSLDELHGVTLDFANVPRPDRFPIIWIDPSEQRGQKGWQAAVGKIQRPVLAGVEN